MNNLEILYQDQFLVIINKPTGLLVHKTTIDKYETSFALQILRNQIKKKVYPVHRLDKPTSGILVFALDSNILKQLSLDWHNVEKEYTAMVRGYFQKEITVDKPLKLIVDKYAKNEKNKVQEATTVFYGLEKAELDYCFSRYPKTRFSIIKAILKTGRKHQIRRHLKHLNNPIVGDANYGKGNINRYFSKIDDIECKRLMLHCNKLTLKHPVSGETLIINADFDKSWNVIYNHLKWQKIT